MDGKTKSASLISRMFFALGIALIVIFGMMLICNLIILVKSTIKPEEPPKLFGIMPMAVRSGSMSGEAADHIEAGDLVFVSSIAHEKLKEGDIVAYLDENRTVVIHRIVSIEKTEESLRFITKGDANNVVDEPVEAQDLIGIYKFRIPKLGEFVLFLQTPLGIILALGTPLLFIFALDCIFRRRKKESE